MRFSSSFFSLFAIALILTACSGKPGPVGRGYSSYKEPYKSAPGPKANGVGYEYSVEKNITALKDMQFAAQDLVSKLDETLAFDTDKVHLAVPPENVFYKSFDHLVRKEFLSRGYVLTQVPDETSPQLDLVVLDNIPPCHTGGEIQDDGPYQTVFMGLLSKEDEKYNMVTGFYEVPLYGFVRSNRLRVEMPECIDTKQINATKPQNIVVENLK